MKIYAMTMIEEKGNEHNVMQSTYNVVDEHLVIMNRGVEDFSKKMNNFIDGGEIFFGFPTDNTWLLKIDSDERWIQDGEQSLKEYLQTVPDYVGGIYIDVVGPHVRKNGSRFPLVSKQCRLYRYDKDILYEGRVHEQITPSIKRKGLKILKTNLPFYIAHLGYDITPEEMEEKAWRDIKLAKKDLEESATKERKVLNCIHLANHYTWLKMKKEAKYYTKIVNDYIKDNKLL